MKRWMWTLAVVCAAAVFPVIGCDDDTSSNPDDGGRDEVGETTGETETADGADADVEEAIEDAPGEEVVDPCGTGVCPNDPVDGPVGMPCVDDTYCEPGFDCWTERVDVFNGEEYISWAGGYCLIWGFEDAGCDPDVTEDCPRGSACTSFGQNDETGQYAYGCVDSCSAASSAGVPWTNNCDCRDGYECSIGGEMCFPGCTNDRECCEVWHDGGGGAADGVRQAGEVTVLPASECTDTCDGCTYTCVREGCPSGDCHVGGPCVHESDCPANARCLDEFGYGADVFPGGVCIQDRCDLSGRECPLGTGCANLGSPGDPFYTCVIPCEAGTEPGDAGYPCRDVGTADVADAGDYACNPVFSADYWFDLTDDTGFCWPGNFGGGTTAFGGSCLEDNECWSPAGLGSCVSLSETPPLFCAASCNDALGQAGFCGGPEGDVDGEPATAVCFSGLCWESCANPNANLGATSTGCTLDNMACYPTSMFGTYIYHGTNSATPAGLCFTPCTNNLWCADMWSIPTTCNVATGVCEAG